MGQSASIDMHAAGNTTEARALVPIRPATSGEPENARAHRPHAAFLAHLIATARQAPQTRQRRRTEPAEAVAAYAERATASPANGSAIARSL